jgi:hypothetical protein
MLSLQLAQLFPYPRNMINMTFSLCINSRFFYSYLAQYCTTNSNTNHFPSTTIYCSSFLPYNHFPTFQTHELIPSNTYSYLKPVTNQNQLTTSVLEIGFYPTKSILSHKNITTRTTNNSVSNKKIFNNI